MSVMGVPDPAVSETAAVKRARHKHDGPCSVIQVAERTAADKKGGHLCTRLSDGRFMLRESAMCPDDDKASFEDISKHKFFNTNNLWVNLPKLKVALSSCMQAIPLCCIPAVHPCRAYVRQVPEREHRST